VSQRDGWLRRPTGILDPILRVAVLVSIGCRSRTSSPRLGDCGTHHIHITRATRGRSPALRLAPRWMPTTVNARDIGAPWGPLMLDAAPNRWRMLKHAGRTVLILGALRNAPVRVATLPKRDGALARRAEWRRQWPGEPLLRSRETASLTGHHVAPTRHR
jgi:hypothetical protein